MRTITPLNADDRSVYRRRHRGYVGRSLAMGLAALAIGAAACRAADQADSPNIIIIMSDDMGYSDIGC